MKKIKQIISMLLVAVWMLCFVPVAQAASTSVSTSRSGLTVGQSVTVTVTFSGAMAAVQFNVNYSASVLRYESYSSSSDLTVNASSGVITSAVMTSDGANASSISCSFTFTAISVGSSSIGVYVNDCIDEEGNPVACSDGSATVTVNASTTSSRPQSSSQSSASSSQPPTVETEPIVVTVGGVTKHVERSLAGIEIPEEFETAEDEYAGEIIEVARGINQDILLMYLTDADGSNGGFYRYVRHEDAFYPFLRIVVNAARYTAVERPETVRIPTGWTATTVTFGNQEIPAYQSDDPAYEGFYLVYAANAAGEVNFYLFDIEDGTMQRYVQSEGYAPVTNPDGTISADPKGNFFERLLSDRPIFVTMCVAWALVVLIAGAWLVFHFARTHAKVSDKQRKTKEEKITRKLEKRAARAAKKNKVAQQKPEIGSLDEETAEEPVSEDAPTQEAAEPVTEEKPVEEPEASEQTEEPEVAEETEETQE